MNDLLVIVVVELSELVMVIVDGPLMLSLSEPDIPGFSVVITR